MYGRAHADEQIINDGSIAAESFGYIKFGQQQGMQGSHDWMRPGYYDEFGWHQTFCMSCHDASNPASMMKRGAANATMSTWGPQLGIIATAIATSLVPAEALGAGVEIAGAEAVSSGVVDAGNAARSGLNILNRAFAPNTTALNKVTAFDFYTGEAGFSASDAINHMRGIDFARPVTPVTIPYGSLAQQYAGPNGVGRYFSPVGATPLEIGITPAGRTQMLFQSMGETRALESFARPDYVYPTGTVPGAGGALQYFVPKRGVFTPICR